ncbi:MAG: hypothetical protein AB3N14_13085 [Flavobacteriaceae bacterium]
MIRSKFKFTLLFLAFLAWSCEEKASTERPVNAEEQIRQIHADYVNGWLAMDEEKVMGLLEENARIQPNRLKPIEGKAEIRKFWFPKDSSITKINAYKTEIISLNILDTLAVSTHTSLLDWTYQKDTLSFGMIQNGINTTVYRIQADKSWKIWRSMWTDISAEQK